MDKKDFLQATKEIYEKAQEMLFELIAELPKFSQECKCPKRDRQTLKMIHESQDDAVMEYCLACGGYI